MGTIGTLLNSADPAVVEFIIGSETKYSYIRIIQGAADSMDTEYGCFGAIEVEGIV